MNNPGFESFKISVVLIKHKCTKNAFVFHSDELNHSLFYFLYSLTLLKCREDIWDKLTSQNLVSRQLHHKINDFLLIFISISFVNVRATDLWFCYEHLR